MLEEDIFIIVFGPVVAVNNIELSSNRWKVNGYTF